MGINDVLKKLYKTITGQDATGMTISEIIAELNVNYPQANDVPIPDIPEYDVSKAGYVLKVNAQGTGLEWVEQ